MSRLLVAGDRAPRFELPDQHGQQVGLAALLEQGPVLVVFYPFAWSGVCTGELTGIQAELADLRRDSASVVAVSCDPMYTLRAWADDQGFGFPLLSDFWPHGATARDYGVFDEVKGRADRGTFLVGTDGVVRWSVLSATGAPRDLLAYKSALAEIP